MRTPLAAFLFSFLAMVGCGDENGTNGSGNLCSNTCEFASDGDCDDGGPSSDFNLCELGTDCADCGARSDDGGGGTPGNGGTGNGGNGANGGGAGGCTNTCSFAGDGECDDGGPDSLTSACDLGTD